MAQMTQITQMFAGDCKCVRVCAGVHGSAQVCGCVQVFAAVRGYIYIILYWLGILHT